MLLFHHFCQCLCSEHHQREKDLALFPRDSPIDVRIGFCKYRSFRRVCPCPLNVVQPCVDTYRNNDENTDNSKYVKMREYIVNDRHSDDGECIDYYHRAGKTEWKSNVSSITNPEVVPASKDQPCEIHCQLDANAAPNVYMKYRSADSSGRHLEKRLFLLPFVWVVFGLGLVYGLRFLLGPIVSIVPTISNDKPIGGSIFSVLFFSVAAVLGVLAVSIYSLGIWNVDLSRRKDKADLGALLVLVTGGLLLWYVPLAFFAVVASVVYLLAVNIE